MNTIILAGGGSGGHVIPALSVLKEIKSNKYRRNAIETVYIGRPQGIERNVFEQQVDAYYSIVTEKWRRPFAIANLKAVFIVLQALLQTIKILYPYRKRAILFHTGGYVGLPPALAAFILRIPIYLHEQTSRAGLANRISAIFARKIFISFASSQRYFPKRKMIWSGYPIGKYFHAPHKMPNALTHKDTNYLASIEKTSSQKPLLLVTGGGNGSVFINQQVIKDLSQLTKRYFVFHQVGRDHLEQFMHRAGPSYLPVGLVSPVEWAYLLRRAALIIARAGAGTVTECIYLNKKTLFIPLEIAQLKEQHHNALQAQQYIPCMIVPEKEARHKPLSQYITHLEKLKHKYHHHPARNNQPSRTSHSQSTKISQRQAISYENFKRKISSSVNTIVRTLLADPRFVNLRKQAPDESPISLNNHEARHNNSNRFKEKQRRSSHSRQRSQKHPNFSRSSSSSPKKRPPSRPNRGASYAKPAQQPNHAKDQQQFPKKNAPKLTQASPAQEVLLAKTNTPKEVKYVENPFRNKRKSPKKKVANL